MRLVALLDHAVVTAGAVVATSMSPGVMVIAARHGRAASVSGLAVGSDNAYGRPLWSHPLDGDLSHTWAGYRIEINEPSVVATDGHVLAVGGTDRLRIDPLTGEIVSSSRATTAPTAAAALVVDELVVPEGRWLAAFDTTTLALLDTLPVPDGMWAAAAPNGTLLPLSDEEGETLAVWDTGANTLWRAPAAGPASQLALVPGAVIVPSGAGAAERLTALDASTGAVLWALDFRDPSPPRPQEGGRYPVRRPLAVHAGRILAVTAAPSVVAVDPDGVMGWTVALDAHPTSFSLDGDHVWVGTSARAILVLDALTGAVTARAELPGLGDHPVQVVPTAAGAALVVGRLGSVHSLVR